MEPLCLSQLIQHVINASQGVGIFHSPLFELTIVNVKPPATIFLLDGQHRRCPGRLTGLDLSFQEEFRELLLNLSFLLKASAPRWLFHGSIVASINRMDDLNSPTYFAVTSDKAILVIEQQLDIHFKLRQGQVGSSPPWLFPGKTHLKCLGSQQKISLCRVWFWLAGTLRPYLASPARFQRHARPLSRCPQYCISRLVMLGS